MDAEWITVYEFADDADRIRALQEASLSSPEAGLAADPLVGSTAWWQQVDTTERPSTRLDGTINRVYWGSMADWPEFSLLADGAESIWTREGDLRRYVEGLHVRLTYVEHAWKHPAKMIGSGRGDASKVVVRVAIEQSRLRSSAIAPGPGGAECWLTRRDNGDVAHYLRFAAADAAEQAIAALEAQGLRARTLRAPSLLGWLVSAWHRDPSVADDWRKTLELYAVSHEGSYDGGEVVEGPVWGASAG